MIIELYNNIKDKKFGYCCSKSHIKINMAYHEFSVQLKATIVHEITHALLHMSKKHYTPIEKEYQARLAEYNFCHSLESKKALIYYKKLLQKENRNLTPLREEVRRIYPEILRISSFSWLPSSSKHKNFENDNKEVKIWIVTLIIVTMTAKGKFAVLVAKTVYMMMTNRAKSL